MKSTLFDVAKHAGVSTATVSRVINNSSLVTEPTRQRVLQTIQHLAYHPSHAARTLARRTTGMIGVVFPGIASGFFTEVLCGIDEAAAEYDFHLTTLFTHGRRDEEALLLALLHEQRCDGVVVLNLSVPDEFFQRAETMGTPLVLLNRPAPATNLPAICIDNAGGAALAIKHLLGHDFQQIAILTGPRDNYDAAQRLAGARQGLAEAGHVLPDELIWSGAFTEESGRTATRRWLDAGHPLPQAIFAGNDSMALGALAELRARGHRVPEDVALIGFDDAETARYVGLTTVRVPMRQMGRMAGETLIHKILHNEQRAPGLLPVSLIERRSCGCNERAEKQEPEHREIQV